MDKPVVIDDERVTEVFVDELGQVLIDGGVCKVTFLVRRHPEGNPADAPLTHRVCCRLVLTPQATVKAAEELTKIAARAMKSGPSAVRT